MTDLLITDVRPWGGPATDVLIVDGVVAASTPVKGVDADGVAVLAGEGRLILPSFTDAHSHLDSTRLGLPFRPHTGGVTVLEQVMNDRANWREAEAGVAERATYTLGLAIANGLTRTRSFAQIDTDCSLERLEGVVAAREAHCGRADVQIVAFPQAGVIRDPGTADLLDQALRSGADVVGGIDPCALDEDPRGQLDAVFALAERHQVPVDIHLHESGELGLFTLGLILARTRALGMSGQVTVSHAFALGTATGAPLAAVMDELAALDVSITTAGPVGVKTLPLNAIVSRGIRVGLGMDGQRDYWSPYGNGDMLDKTWQLAFTNGFRRDDDIETCLAVATLGGAAVIDGRRPSSERGFGAGDAAEFVLIPGETPTAAVMDRPGGRTVVHAGRVVADAGELR
jgi:cytosine/adenosine deaminase-related metal-dependent hydrolase